MIKFFSQLIKNLESEREELRKNLKLAESKTNMKKDENKTGKLSTLLSEKGNGYGVVKFKFNLIYLI
jgi:hypothetical protein